MKVFLEKVAQENSAVKEEVRQLRKSVDVVTVRLNENNKETKETSTLVRKLYDSQERSRKEANFRANKEERDRRRERADTGLKKFMSATKERQAVKEERKGLLDSLLGGFNLGGLGGPAILAALGLGAIGTAIAAYIGSEDFRNFVNQYILDPLGKTLQNLIQNQLPAIIAQTPITNGPLNTKPSNAPTTQNIPTSQTTVNEAINIQTQKANDPSTSVQGRKDANWNIEGLQKLKQIQNGILQTQGFIKMAQKKIAEYDKDIAQLQAQRQSLSDPVSKANNWLNIQYLTKLRDMETNGELAKQEQKLKLQEQDFNSIINKYGLQDELGIQARRRGGFLAGNGNGDTVPAMLERGEYVLNKNAVGMVGVDTLDKLNHQQAPRFQSGGYVGTPKSQLVDTGYKDKSGRPILLSPGAAAAWKKMIDAGMPMNPGDVTSVHRDEAEYNAILQNHLAGVPGYGRPAANSHHNHGNAADIHGAMNSWIRVNGAQYGWHANDYKGTHGGHFEYRGDNSGPLPGTGGSGTGGSGTGGGNFLGNLLSMGLGQLKGVPVLGDFVSGFEEGYKSTAKAGGLAEGLMQFIFGGGNNQSGPRVGPDGIPYSGTGDSKITGTVEEKLKQIATIARDAGFTDAQARIMAAIAMAESGGDPNNDTIKSGLYASTGETSYGLWQINMTGDLGPDRMRRFGLNSVADLYNPAINAKIAKSLFDGRGGNYTDWSVYTSGKYLDYYKPSLQFNKGGLVPNPKDTVPAMLTPGEYVVPQETVSKIGAAALRGLDNEVTQSFREANNMKMGQDVSMMIMQPIIMPMGEGGGSSAPTTAEPQGIPTLPNNPGNDFALGLVMTHQLLSTRIGG